MKLQKATENQIELIQELASKSWVSYRGIISDAQIEYMLSTMYSKEELGKHFQNENYHYYFILDDENFMGFMGFEHQYEPETTKLHRIYLIPEAKGKGLGKFAISFLKEKVKDSGDKKIILNVNKENSAKEFYENLGFTISEEIVADIGNGFVMDDYIMSYKIL